MTRCVAARVGLLDIEVVAVYGTRIAVGRPHYDASGLAQVYALTLESGWTLEQNFTGYGVDGENVGAAVAIDGDLLVVGAPRTDADVYGIVFVYERSGSQWNYLDCLWSPDSDNGNGYGSAVALSASDVLAGAPRADGSGGELDAGAVYIWYGLGSLFYDGFESGGNSAWSSSVP